MKEILKELKINKLCLWNIILSVVSYVGVILYYGTSSNLNFSIFFLLFYGFILLFFLKFQVKVDKKTKRISFVLGIILTLCLVIGKTVDSFTYTDVQIIFTLKRLIHVLIEGICIFPLVYRLLNSFYFYLGKLNIKVNNDRKSYNKFFFYTWIFIFICYLPYFWRYFPGKLTTDSYLQLTFIKDGILSNIHPFLQTQFVGFFYNIGNMIFHSENMGIAFYIIVQMIIMSCLFAYACRFLYKRKIDIRICLAVVFVYALLPMYTHYSVTMWKDVMFGGCFILVLISLLEFAITQNKISISQCLLFILGILLMMFFRNNGIYIVLFMTPFILFVFRKKIILFAPMMVGLISIYFVVTGPIYNMMGVQKIQSVEAFSVPLQQIARVFALEEEVDRESLKYLNSIMDTSKIKDNYLPYISDPIKGLTNREKLDDSKGELIKVWTRLLIEHPRIYVEAYLAQTVGYWSPDVDYWVTLSQENDTSMPSILCNIIDHTASKRLPFANVFWSIGLGFIVTLLSFSLSIYRKNKLGIVYIPFLGLWLTMMLASPVYAEFRYVYGLFTCLPIILCIPFLNKEKNNYISI